MIPMTLALALGFSSPAFAQEAPPSPPAEALEAAGDAAEQSLEQAGADAERALEAHGQSAEQAIEEAGRTAEAALRDAERALEAAARDTDVSVRDLLIDLRDELRDLRDEVDDIKSEAAEELAEARLEAAEEAAEALEEAAEIDLEELLSRARGPVHTYGDDVLIGEDEVVKEVATFGGDIEVRGVVVEDVRSFGGDVLITETGRVLGDAKTFGGNVTIEPGGVLEGSPDTLGGKVVVEAGGVVDHHRPRTPFDKEDPMPLGGWILGGIFSFYRWLVFLLAFAGAGVLVVALFPDRVTRVAEQLEQRPLQSGLAGLGWALGILVASVLFFWTILGPLVGAAMLGVAWMLGFVGLCQMLGDRLPFAYKPHGRWIAFLVGSLVISLLGALPWVGTITVVGASLFGIGAAFNSRFGSA